VLGVGEVVEHLTGQAVTHSGLARDGEAGDGKGHEIESGVPGGGEVGVDDGGQHPVDLQEVPGMEVPVHDIAIR
jgi:hypothetical protein